MEIKYFKHNQIDKQKWDSAIESSKNAMVYALSWFLDTVSPNWEALVYDDYDFIMPVTWKSKLGVKYLYQPVFVQQLGIFSSLEISKEIVQEFVSQIEKHFKFVDIQLNYANPELEQESFILRNTQLIDISKSYDDLYVSYSKNHKKNLIKINDSGIEINTNGDSSDFIELIRNMFIIKGVDEITQLDISNLKLIIDYCNKNDLGELYFGHMDNKMCASAFFLKWGKRVIVYTALNEIGRTAGAMFGLIDKYIKENSEQDLLFDFAGSNIPGVKYRNMGFGAKNETYFRLKINNLPLPLKWLKK